ncbi:MAG: hypothetical protein ABWY19_10060 [Marmoricola sp.]
MPTASSHAASYDEAVAGWADHLRSGGTTTWSAWLAQPRPTAPAAGPRPDAVHLELVRRLNLAAGQPVPGLADRVLATASPGRGLVDVPLVWPAARRTYGSPAMDPEQLPEEELIRLAVGVVVHLLPGLPRPAARVPAQPWPWPWRRRFQLHGSPITADGLRRGLLERGLVDTDWRPTHVVVARPVEVMMAEHWAGNARNGGILKWSTLWRRVLAAGRLPRPVDVVSIADRLAGREREPLHVVVARDAQVAAETTARLLGTQPFVLHGTADLARTDLQRRVNRLTALTAGAESVKDLAARLASVLAQGDLVPDPPRPPVVPPGAEDWARDQAARTAAHLRAAGYAVHGNPDELLPADHRHPGTVDRTRTLDLALAACLRTWRRQEGTP